ncbi:MAG: CoA transferase [Bacillota bacterium]|nr:MAG: CoA transferase [Bacillota bacterium]
MTDRGARRHGGIGLPGPLAGIRVVDVTTNIAGPTLTWILAQLGAEVIKVERPDEGDEGRAMGPLWNGHGVYFLAINTNKRSIAVNLKDPRGQECVRRLVAQADVFVENFRRGKAEALGLGYDDLRRVRPDLVYCSVSAFGEKGPDAAKPGYDSILQARTGIMSVTGTPDGPPVRAGVSILDGGTAMWGALAVVSALYHRAVTGQGQRVGVSLFETGVAWMNYHLMAYQATGRVPPRQGGGHNAFAPYGSFPCRDGAIVIGISNDRLFRRLCEALGLVHLVDDPRFKDNPSRVRNRAELDALLSERLQTDTVAAWIQRLTEAGVPCGPIQTVDQLLEDPQLEAAGMLLPATHPHIPNLRVPRIPMNFEACPPPAVVQGAPLLGQDTWAVLRDAGYPAEELKELWRERVLAGPVPPDEGVTAAG